MNTAVSLHGRSAFRWWIYQRERFPVFAHGLLIAAFSFSAVSFSFLLRGGEGLPKTASIVTAFLTAFLFFLQLRIADEFKDFEEDSRYRPYRAVPRGLVSLKELGGVGLIGAAIQLSLALWLLGPTWGAGEKGFSPGLAALLVAVWCYLAAMSKEFFARRWLKARPFTYMWTHMLIIPLVDLYATSCDWMPAGNGQPPSGLFWFLVLSFFNGMVLELGRKIRAPEDEETGVETYTALWGRRRAVGLWLSALLITGICAWRASIRIEFALPLLIVLAVFFAGAGLISRRFLRHPGAAAAKWFERFSGLWSLTLYLSLGPIPLLTQTL